MRRSTLSCLVAMVTVAILLVAILLPICAQAKPKKKIYNNSSEQVLLAAVRTARERHVVTYVNEKMLMFTFETGDPLRQKGLLRTPR